MFNSAILDVMIGLAFVYTLLSMICSTLTEWIAGIRSARSKNLWKGIESLLGPQVTLSLYNHPLIKGLTTQKDKPPKKGKPPQKGKPSYIPADTFFLALMDMILKPETQSENSQDETAEAARFEEARQEVNDLPLDDEIRKAVLAQIQKVAELPGPIKTKEGLLEQIMEVAKDSADPTEKKKRLGMIDAQIVNVRALMRSTSQDKPVVKTPTASGKVVEVKNAITNFSKDNKMIGRAFLALIENPEIDLIEDEKEQLKKMQENAEKWFDDAMDRVSGWYKRYTQIVIFCCALVVTVAVNVDTLKIVNKLWYNTTMRDAIASSAQELIYEPSSFEDNQETQVGEDSTREPSLPENAQDSITSPLGGNQNFQVDDDPQKASAQENDQGSWDRITTFQKELQDRWSLIGWTEEEWKDLTSNGPMKIAGWLLTAIAVSLGAPFWFDLLNKLVSLRATGNRPKKSSEPSEEKQK